MRFPAGLRARSTSMHHAISLDQAKSILRRSSAGNGRTAGDELRVVAQNIREDERMYSFCSNVPPEPATLDQAQRNAYRIQILNRRSSQQQLLSRCRDVIERHRDGGSLEERRAAAGNERQNTIVMTEPPDGIQDFGCRTDATLIRHGMGSLPCREPVIEDP